MKKLTFTTWDYVVFTVCLVLSVAIGLKYAFTGGKQKTTDEFLMANREMRYGPVALSLMVSFISAITVLGVPSEVYIHGTAYCFLAFSYFICFPVVAHIFIPVFHKLRITSVYEYLELRFSKAVRVCGTVTYMLMLVIYMGVVLYTPALALNAVTNINEWMTIIILCLVCTLYTTLGGLKAVIWTDVFQGCVMLGVQILVIILGVSKVGGFGKVLEINKNANKLSFPSINPSPFERHTIWTLCIGGAIMCTTLYGTSQTAVQRYMSCRTERDAQVTAYLNVPLLIIVMMTSCLLGMTIYADYHCENPLGTGAITKPDQLLIYYVMDLLGEYPSLPGLFVSCLFCAALSTISSCFNALATLAIKDLITPFVKISDRRATVWSKVLAGGFGMVCLIMSAVASVMGSVLIAAISIFGIMGGPLLGLFILGMFFRRANSIGALAGFLSSLLVIFLIGFGSIAYYIAYMPHPVYSIYDEMCIVNITTAPTYSVSHTADYNTSATQATLNSTLMLTSLLSTDLVGHEHAKLYTGFSFIFKLSYMWYSGLSVIMVLIVGLPVSYFTNDGNTVDSRTLHSIVSKIESCSCSGTRRIYEVNISLHDKGEPITTSPLKPDIMEWESRNRNT